MAVGFDGYPVIVFGNCDPIPPDMDGYRFAIVESPSGDDFEVFFSAGLGPNVNVGDNTLIDMGTATVLRVYVPYGYIDIDLFHVDMFWDTEYMYFFFPDGCRVWNSQDVGTQFVVELREGVAEALPVNDTDYDVTVGQASVPNDDNFGYSNVTGFTAGTIAGQAQAAGTLYGSVINELMYDSTAQQWRLVLQGDLWQDWFSTIAIEIPSDLSTANYTSAAADSFSTDGTTTTWVWNEVTSNQTWKLADVTSNAVVNFDTV